MLSASTIWWLLSGGLVAIELMTGTFYLLMLAIGAAAGALVALAGGDHSSQISVAAIVGALTSTLWHFKKKRSAKSDVGLGVQNVPDLSLDLGQPVMVDHWHENGSTQVMYRGAFWTARLNNTDSANLVTGPHRIVAMQGNIIIIEKV